MEIRPIKFADLPALVELEAQVTVAALPEVYPAPDRFPRPLHLQTRSKEFSDPWITFTLAEDDQGVAGWIEYTEDQLRNLIIAPRVNDSGLRDELYGEGLRHWRAGETPRVWLWVLAGDQSARADYESRGWRATGRTRRSALTPHPVIAEYLLTLG